MDTGRSQVTATIILGADVPQPVCAPGREAEALASGITRGFAAVCGSRAGVRFMRWDAAAARGHSGEKAAHPDGSLMGSLKLPGVRRQDLRVLRSVATL
eukprot:2108298-Prymnesium_polylepis.1